MAGVLCVGIATQDFVFGLDRMPLTAEKHRARQLTVVGGGISGTAAVAVARLGGRSMLATRLGDDPLARDIVAALEADGVDCSLVLRLPGRRSPLSAVLVDSAGERLVVSWSELDLPPAADMLPAALPPGIGAVMADTRWEEGGLRLFAAARSAGGAGVLDADRPPGDRALLDAATHVAFAAQALRELNGIADPRAALEHYAASASNWVAVTDGARGVHVCAGGRLSHVPAFPVEAVDTLGAGDVWHGAFALGLAEGMGERAAVRFASAAAALKCTRFGGRAGAPTRAEVETLMRTQEEVA